MQRGFLSWFDSVSLLVGTLWGASFAYPDVFGRLWEGGISCLAVLKVENKLCPEGQSSAALKRIPPSTHFKAGGQIDIEAESGVPFGFWEGTEPGTPPGDFFACLEAFGGGHFLSPNQGRQGPGSARSSVTLDRIPIPARGCEKM